MLFVTPSNNAAIIFSLVNEKWPAPHTISRARRGPRVAQPCRGRRRPRLTGRLESRRSSAISGTRRCLGRMVVVCCCAVRTWTCGGRSSARSLSRRGRSEDVGCSQCGTGASSTERGSVLTKGWSCCGSPQYRPQGSSS